MSDIKYWSSAAASNNEAAPNGFPEGMAPSGLNDGAREVMAATRRWYEDAQWVDLGWTPTYASASTFTLAGDKTGTFEVGRRIRAKNGSSTFYANIDSATYTAGGNTGVYCTLDTGSFTTSLTAVAVGMLSSSNHSVPRYYVASASISTIASTNITVSTLTASTVAVLGVLTTNTINESTTASGVTVDGCLIKDGMTPVQLKRVNNAVGSHVLVLDITATSTNYVTVGPTGSGANIIFTQLDGISSGASWVNLMCMVQAYHGPNAGTVNGNVELCYNDANNYVYGTEYAHTVTIEDTDISVGTHFIPLDANKMFKIKWSHADLDDSFSRVWLRVQGYIIGSA